MLVSINRKIAFKLLLICTVLLSILCTNSIAVVSPTEEFYVNDYAQLLNKETRNYIIDMNKRLYESTGAQIVVVTITSLQGQNLETYATQLFREFGIGNKQKNNGVLLLLALKERKFRIEVGYGLEGVLTDAKTGRIQDEYIIPYLKNDNWNDGIKNGFNAVLNEVTKEYNLDVGAQTAVNLEYNNFIGIALLFVSIIICPILSRVYSGIVAGRGVIKVISILYFITMIVINYFIRTSFNDFAFAFFWHAMLVSSIFTKFGRSYGRIRRLQRRLWLGRKFEQWQKLWRRRKVRWWR